MESSVFSAASATIEIRMTRSTEPGAPGAIVLGGNFIGLGVARSLGRRGIPVWVYDTGRAIAGYSRYTSRFVISKRNTLELLLDEGRKHGLNGWVLFPIADPEVETLAIHHQALSSIYRVTTPPFDVSKFALDKRLTYAKARELGIATPLTIANVAGVGNIAKDIPYPVILKPAMNHHFFPHTGFKVVPVNTPAEFQSAYAQITKYLPPDEVMIQERIPGGGENQFSFAAVCKDGKAYASLVARRRRQYPVDFGNGSSFVETTDQPIVEAHGRKLLESIGFDGMAEVEFKFDRRDNSYKVLDLNIRPWGWHMLGRPAGLDFCYLLWRQKLGYEVSPAPAAHRATWFRELNDCLAIAGSPHRATEIKRLMKAMLSGHFTGATFALTDPAPFVAEFAFRASEGRLFRRRAQPELSVDA